MATSSLKAKISVLVAALWEQIEVQVKIIAARTLAAIVLAVAVMFAPEAYGQQTDGRAEMPSSQTSIEAAPVIVDGQAIFELRGATAFPASERAVLVAERIRDIAKDVALDPNSLTIATTQYGLEIALGGRVIVTLVDADAELEGVRLAVLAEVTRERIREAISSYRAERSRPGLISSAIYAGAALVLTGLVAISIVFLARWLLKVIDRSRAIRTQEVRIQSLALIRADQIYLGVRSIIKAMRWVIVAILIFAGIDYALSQFPWTRAVANTMETYVAEPLEVIGIAVLGSIPNLIYIAIIIVLTVFLLRLILVLFRAIERGAITLSGFDSDWAIPTFKAVRLLVIVLAVVAAFPYIPGARSEAFKGVSILLGLMLSLGSSSVISSIIAGYTLIYRRTFKVGDWIQVGETVGKVVDRRLLTTKLVSRKNETIVLPNSLIITTEVVNFTTTAQSNGLILHTSVGIGYDVPWHKVESMLIEAAGRVDGLSADPPPFVLEKSLDNYAVNYEINAYCDEPERIAELYAELHRSILTVFANHDVQIMTPTYVGLSGETDVILSKRSAVSRASNERTE